MLHRIGYTLRDKRRGDQDEESNAAERLVRAGAPDVLKVQQLEAEKAKALVRREALDAKQTPEQADAAAASTGLGSATPNLDRGVQTPNLDRLAQAKSPMGGGGETAGATLSFKSSGEEYMYKAKNAIRALQGLPPVDQELNPRDKFQVDIEKSVSFGDKSGLLTPTGHAKAFERGIRAGYSSDEVNGMLKGASERIKPTADAAALTKSRSEVAQSNEELPNPYRQNGDTAIPEQTGLTGGEGRKRFTMAVKNTDENTTNGVISAGLGRTDTLPDWAKPTAEDTASPVPAESAKASADAIRFTDALKASQASDEASQTTPPNTLITKPVTLGSIDNRNKAVAQRSEDLSYNSGVLGNLVASVKKSGLDLNTVLDTLFTGGEDNVKAYQKGLTGIYKDKFGQNAVTTPPKFEEALKALNDSEAMSNTEGFDDALKDKVLDYRTKKWNKGNANK